MTSIRDAAPRVGLVVLASLAVGLLTPWAQGALPEALGSLANSATGWSIPTAALVCWLARGYGEAAVAGAAAFVTMTVGYALGADWRGGYYDPTFWAVVGIVAGPVIGSAAHALRREALPAALGAGLLAGVLIGEAAYGLTEIADTTSPVFWWLGAALGAALLGGVALRLARPRPILLACATAAVVAVAFVFAYRSLGSLSI